MLHIFDELRRLAMQAVLGGLQDAMQELEQSPLISDEQLPDERWLHQLDSAAAASDVSPDKNLPPPRKRGPGRPRKRPEGES